MLPVTFSFTQPALYCPGKTGGISGANVSYDGSKNFSTGFSHVATSCVRAVYCRLPVRKLARDGGRKKALDAISTDASVVFRVKKPKATLEKLASLVDLVQPGFGGQVRTNGMAIGAAIANPTLAGVDMDNDWWVAVFASADSTEPVIVYVIPGTDLKAMKEALGDEVQFIEHETWGVYTSDEDTAKDIAALLKGEGDDESISTEMDKESTTAFNKGDLSVFVNISQLTEEYKDQLTAAQDKLKEALDNIPEEATAAQGINSEALGEAFSKVANGLYRGFKTPTPRDRHVHLEAGDHV